MTESSLTEEKTSTLLEKLRAKVWMARWNLLLWAVFTVAISIACWLLFPGALFQVDGGLRGILLVTSIDLILGPVLFLLVANPAKSLRERRVDVTTLTAIQLLAMAWGGWQVYVQRPVAISYMYEGFAMPLTTSPFAQQKISPDSLPSSPLGTLPAFYVDLPRGEGFAQAYYQLTRSKIPINAQAALLKPLFNHEQVLLSVAHRFQSYWTGEGAVAWQSWTSRHDGKPPADYRFILLRGRYGNAVLILDQSNQLVGHILLAGEDPPSVLLVN